MADGQPNTIASQDNDMRNDETAASAPTEDEIDEPELTEEEIEAAVNAREERDAYAYMEGYVNTDMPPHKKLNMLLLVMRKYGEATCFVGMVMRIMEPLKLGVSSPGSLLIKADILSEFAGMSEEERADVKNDIKQAAEYMELFQGLGYTLDNVAMARDELEGLLASKA